MRTKLRAGYFVVILGKRKHSTGGNDVTKGQQHHWRLIACHAVDGRSRVGRRCRTRNQITRRTSGTTVHALRAVCCDILIFSSEGLNSTAYCCV